MSTTHIHKIVLDHVCQNVLPYVFQIQDTGIPYPAELWNGQTCTSHTGTVMIAVDNDRLIAEYFAYDIEVADLMIPSGVLNDHDAQWMIVLKGTRTEIPVAWIGSSNKARTLYTNAYIQAIKPYECRIRGWVGNPKSEINAAVMTLTDLPSLRMPSSSLPLPDKVAGDNLTLLRSDAQTPALTLKAGDWKITLMEFESNTNSPNSTLHTATLHREDQSPFELSGDDEGIITALRQFLSFQAGHWINMPTVIGYTRDISRITKRAYIGNLTSRKSQVRNRWTATDFETWPALFNEFWKRYNRNRGHLNNAVYHYITCSEILEDEFGLYYAAVAARSTLEALTRWWNGQNENFDFGGKPENQLSAQLMIAVERAELGKDMRREIDTAELDAVMKQASKLRNRIDHGRAGNIDSSEIREILAHQQYMHNLARLLILAKLGLRTTDARGSLYSPTFNQISE